MKERLSVLRSTTQSSPVKPARNRLGKDVLKAAVADLLMDSSGRSSCSSSSSSSSSSWSVGKQPLHTKTVFQLDEQTIGMSQDRDDGKSPSPTYDDESSIAYVNVDLMVDPQEGQTLLQQRLLEYGIVPLEKKKPSGGCDIQQAVDQVHRWLFVEGGHFEDVEALMTNYCEFLRHTLSVPVDRLYYGGVGLHPKLTAYLWKWELNEEFVMREMPQEIFERRNELFSPDEPFCVLEQGRADSVRIVAKQENIPPDTNKWFVGGGYRDYYALPDIHRNQSKGAMAWATKHPSGFTQDHIAFFEWTMPALTTVMRLHTNDLVLRTLTERMEREIQERTLELAQANDDLALANAQLEQHQTKQLEHFACMSHEIRTPLNCIVGLSSLMLTEEDFDPLTTKENLQMIHSSADLLNAVVDDVLDYAKMESGSVFQVDIRSTDLQNTVASVLHAMRQKSASKNVLIVTHFGTTLPTLVETDPRRLQQVLYNLLGNACKFSKQGGTVELHLWVEQEQYPSGCGYSLQLSVKDYGKGIAQENLETIFEPFQQENKETSTLYGGTGLGLSITSKLVERLGGNIHVDSVLGEFAQFTVSLPCSTPPPSTKSIQKSLQHKTLVLWLKNDKEHPFGPHVVQEYGLDLEIVSSWQQVLDVPAKRFYSCTNDAQQHYVLMVPTDELDKCYKTFPHKATWIVYGYGSSSLTGIPALVRHWNNLSKLFPAVALQDIIEWIQEKHGVANTGGTPSTTSLPSTESTTVSFTTTSSTTTAQDDNENDIASSDLSNRPPSHSSKSEDEEGHIPHPIGIIELPAKAFLSQEHKSVVKNVLKSTTTTTAVASPPTATTASTKRTSSPSPSKQQVKTIPTLKVLYAEDNKINQKVLNRMLSKLGVVDLEIVDDGLQAVERTSQETFDLVFMDIQMPVMDGLEATKRIKASGDSPRIVFCTAHALQDFRQEAQYAGGDGFVSKPFNIQKIQQILEEAAVATISN